jgi:hypothetical protein
LQRQREARARRVCAQCMGASVPARVSVGKRWREEAKEVRVTLNGTARAGLWKELVRVGNGGAAASASASALLGEREAEDWAGRWGE